MKLLFWWAAPTFTDLDWLLVNGLTVCAAIALLGIYLIVRD